METTIIGYLASTTSLVAFGSQFYHIVKSKKTEGISIYRTVFDVISLGLWVIYAARVEDNPLLSAATFEFVTSIGIFILLIYKRHKPIYAIKDWTPPPSPPGEPQSFIIDVRSERRNSV
jgi:uncharacterized protein with PQ loop repeat